ncbi:ran-specific GTPase-activating protein-like [Biomphalaria glabrata]|uniref:Ran-specific GTPase-activating protein-like n=1 Tax=Biomphalaria glabrata TaxID=6526 RepID=A0A9W2YHJ8_BIOGL|nr:ran-specific GTPase-activating protein-like [Biomphalaria glabrata]KAI8728478.1 ran-specific GTPase-activating protein 1-like [Biomphalaria glabrata]KAI8740009.1 ran-specific GTPase-activating protein 1 [Biomphalaria glabrata]
MADEKDDHEPESPDIHFEPLVKLSLIEKKTMEEDEDVLLCLRAKLFRYDVDAEPKEWKERGTGDCKILKHRRTGLIRILMRRDKTLKICANHYIYPNMELKPNCDSDRAWVWSTTSDFADEEMKEEVLAIRFAKAESAQKFKSVFDESAEEMKTAMKNKTLIEDNDEDDEKEDDGVVNTKPDASDTELAGQLKDLKVEDADNSTSEK